MYTAAWTEVGMRICCKWSAAVKPSLASWSAPPHARAPGQSRDGLLLQPLPPRVLSLPGVGHELALALYEVSVFGGGGSPRIPSSLLLPLWGELTVEFP